MGSMTPPKLKNIFYNKEIGRKLTQSKTIWRPEHQWRFKVKKKCQSVEKTLFQLDHNKNYHLFVITSLVCYVVFLKAFSVKRLY